MLSNQSQLFSLPTDLTYLNNAYMAPQLKSVEQAGIRGLSSKNDPTSIRTETFFEDRVILKKKFAQLIDTDQWENIAIIPSVSYGMTNVANNIPLKAGDEILVVDEQFPSNIYCWQTVAKQHGATIKIVSIPDQMKDRGRIWNEAILEAINEKTAVVTIAHVHWADGTLFDLKALREKTTLVNAKLVIDGTQSVGALPLSMKDIPLDALVCGGYKWLMGPYSLGVAYYAEDLCTGNPIEHNWINKFESEDFTNLTKYQDRFQPGAERYSVGESSNFALLPMLIESIDQLLKWTPERIQEYTHHISIPSIQELRAQGFYVEEEKYRGSHLFGIYLPEHIDINTVKEKLKVANIFVSYRGQAIRVSCHLYNKEEDFKKLVDCTSNL